MDDIDLDADGRREAVKAALGVDSPQEAIDLTVDSIIVMLVHIGQAQRNNEEAKAITMTTQLIALLEKMHPTLKSNALLFACTRLVSIGPDGLSSTPEGLTRAARGARALRDFGIVPEG